MSSGRSGNFGGGNAGAAGHTLHTVDTLFRGIAREIQEAGGVEPEPEVESSADGRFAYFHTGPPDDGMSVVIDGADQTLRRLPSTAADEAADGSDSDIPDLVSFSDDDDEVAGG